MGWTLHDMKHKLLKMVQVTVPIFFYFDEKLKIKNEAVWPKNLDFE